MRGADAARRLAYLLPLAAAAFLAAMARSGAVPPGLVFAAVAAYARLAALLGEAAGVEEALLFADALPFLAFCLARISGSGALAALALAGEAACSLAALLLVEAAAAAGRRPIGAAVAFVAASAACGAAIDRLPAATVAGGAVALAASAAYVLARRAR